MVILGIDPGFSYTGFGIAKKDQITTTLVYYGCLKMSSTQSLSVRIGIFYRFFEKLIIEYHIESIAIETPFLGKNAQNFLKLGYLRGIIYLLADTYKTKLYEFAPREVKQSVTGYGAASKDQVSNMVHRFFPRIGKKPEKYDVTDALAVMLCGLWYKKLDQKCR